MRNSNSSLPSLQEEKKKPGRKRDMAIVRSRNKKVDAWLEEEEVIVGDDAFTDLDDFLV